MKNAVFWNGTSCGSCKNRRFGGTYRLHIRVIIIGELVTALAVTSNQIVTSQKMVFFIVMAVETSNFTYFSDYRVSTEYLEFGFQPYNIMTCSTDGRRCYATLLSLLGNRSRTVPRICSPLGIVALHGNQQ
jgi:hypothetical protein